jgi:hypothetical protein
MYTLTSESLEVAILDPLADQGRFGTRYCTGGYIFQVTDHRHGALLSGPTYPDSFNWFDGQGIPDAFNLSPLCEQGAGEPAALIVGIGVCDLQANQVREFCSWDVQQHDSAIAMRTTHAFQGFALDLERTVALRGRTLRSATLVRNTGRLPIPIRWFPHPFFPHPATDELCRLNIPVALPDDASYELAESGFIARKRWPWTEGHFHALDHAGQSNLVVLQKHPLLGLIAATCSYIPSYFPIWGNPQTFSWEPFLERTVGAGQELAWWIDYDF